MNVNIPRDALVALLEYAEAEIETRCGCLKNVLIEDGTNKAELEDEVSEANDLFATIREAMKDQKYQPCKNIRHPMLEIGDKFSELHGVILGETIMHLDNELVVLIKQLGAAYCAVKLHLDNNYQWD